MFNGRRITLGLAALAASPMLAAFYAGAYLGLGEWNETAAVHCRAYRTVAEARLFHPAATVESWLTGRRVACWVRDSDDGIYQP